MHIKVNKGRERGKLDRVDRNYSHKSQLEVKILSKVPRILGDMLIQCLRTLVELSLRARNMAKNIITFILSSLYEL